MTAIFAAVLDGPSAFEAWKLQDFALAASAWGVDEVWYVDACAGVAHLPGSADDAKALPKIDLRRVKAHERRTEIREIASIGDALAEAKARELRPIFVEGPHRQKPEAVEAGLFRHPADALYIFGGDRSSGLAADFLGYEDADWIHLKATRGVYAHQAATVVAYLRAKFRDR